jgi:pimeloyl-[acyl-carrier protein] methyl ester esterase
MQPLFISGWGATDQVWDGVLSAMPGMNPQFICWADCAQNWPRALAAALSEDEQYCIVGWSLGGLLALRAALEFPHKIAGLVLISATARMCATDDHPGADPRALAAMQAGLAKDPVSEVCEFANICFAPEGDVEVLKHYLEQANSYSVDHLAAGLDCLATLDLRSRLGEVSAPCRLLHGARDRVVPVASARYLAGKLPNARLQVLERRGHALPFTAPGEVAQHIRGFFA